MTLTLIKVPDRPGVCRWCSCTEDAACLGGCGWANRAKTVCDRCFILDQAMRTRAGRRQIAHVMQGRIPPRDVLA